MPFFLVLPLIRLTLFLKLVAVGMIKHQGKMYPFFWKLGLPSSDVSFFSRSLPAFLLPFTIGFTLERLAVGYRVYGRDTYLVIHDLVLAEASIFLPPLGFTPGMALRGMVVWVTKTLVELVEVGEWNSGVKNLCLFWTDPRLPPPPPKDCLQQVIWLMWKEVSVDFFWAEWGQSSHSPFREHIRFSEISQPCSKLSTYPHFSLF